MLYELDAYLLKVSHTAKLSICTDQPLPPPSHSIPVVYDTSISSESTSVIPADCLSELGDVDNFYQIFFQQWK